MGREGEALAARYIEGLGWRVVDANWRSRRGEIDLVARDGSWLVIVEVRTRRGTRFGTAVESVGPVKRRRLVRLGLEYVHARRWTGPWRIDVVGVQMAAGAAPQIVHVRHAVEA